MFVEPKKIILRQIVFIAFCFGCFQIVAQPYRPVSVSLAEGLAQSSVYCIVQNEIGFTWMGTQDGLCRYDGIGFKIYREDPFDSASISSNFITALHVDKRGWMWAGTQHSGVNVFIPGTDQFRHINMENTARFPSNNINRISSDRHGNVWVATGNGVALLEVTEKPDVFDAKIKCSVLSGVEFKKPDESFQVYDFVLTHDDEIWMASSAGLLLYERIDNSFRLKNYFHRKNSILPSDRIISVVLSRSGKLVFATTKSLYEIENGMLKPVFTGNSIPQGTLFQQLFISSSGHLWVGTDGNGLFRIKSSDNGYFDWLNSEKISLGNARLTGSVMAFFEDRISRNLIWTGTFAGGCVRLVPVLKNFRSDKMEYEHVTSPVVRSILKDHFNQIWIGTQEGLFIKKSDKETPEKIILAKDNGRLFITGMVLGSNHQLWISTAVGVFLIQDVSRPEKKILHFPLLKQDERSFVNSIYTDDIGQIFAIKRLRVFRYHEPVNDFIPVADLNNEKVGRTSLLSITAFYSDGLNLMLGTNTGLVFIENENGSFKKTIWFTHDRYNKNSLRSSNIYHITKNKNGDFWLGTANGLTLLRQEKGQWQFTNYSTESNISNNTIYTCVPEKETGMLWLSTNGGLTRFDPGGVHTVNFDINDGLQSNEFNGGAYSVSADGEFFFGGIQGYTSFYPDQILIDTLPPRVFISGFMMPDLNKRISFSKEGTRQIKLKHFENSFSIYFNAFHYHDPAKNQFVYMLEGFQSDWMPGGTARQVNFSGLPPGEYLFKVKASNSDGIFNQVPDKLRIIITPPFHQTIWFYALIAVLIAIAFLLFHRYRLQIKLAKIKEAERIRKETAADFHDELGHKLTTISWFSDILRNKIPDSQNELRQYLDKIIETSSGLYHTMKDLLWAMDPEKDSAFETYEQLRNFGQELFDHTGIEFTSAEALPEMKNVILPLSYKRHILLIFKEVMHNSMKHAQATSMHLDVEQHNGSLTMRFSDNGKGFSRESVSASGHGIKNVIKRAEIINARHAFHSNGNGMQFEITIDIYKN